MSGLANKGMHQTSGAWQDRAPLAGDPRCSADNREYWGVRNETYGRTTVVATLLGLALQCPQPAVAEEIRILLLTPRTAGNRSQQRLEEFARAIMASGGPLTPVGHLDEADIVVEFTDYRRKLSKAGEPQQRWDGNFKIVVPLPQKRSRRRLAPEHFSIVVTGPDEWGQHRAVAVLGDLLAKALGRQQARARPEHI